LDTTRPKDLRHSQPPKYLCDASEFSQMNLHTNDACAHSQPRVNDQLIVEQACLELATAGYEDGRFFKIRSADSFISRRSASHLLQRRYGWRGYSVVSLPAAQTSNRITLTATENNVTIGTITVGLDGPEGMNCEDQFESEVDVLRSQNLRLCEFTKLATDPVRSTKRVLAALFHVAYIVAHRMRRYDMLLMEVNPRHVRYYERMLGARVIGHERINKAVNAPAVLLALPFGHIREQVAKFAGRPELAANERSLYPFGFTSHEEEGIVQRLISEQVPASLALN
jgi:hypothetical protein